MRIVSYNVENLFRRAKALNLSTWSEGKPILDAVSQLNTILNEANYTPARKDKIIDILKQLGLTKSDIGQYAILRQNRGKLLKRPKSSPLQIVANGREDWIGWVELTEESINETAMLVTAKVLHDTAGDIVGVVEAENRIALKKFSEQLLKDVGGKPYAHVMVIDGNDDRGIDVGIMTRKGYDILSINSHVDDTDTKGVIFGRDCPEYAIRTPSGETVWVLVNHFKSKGYGKPGESDDKRQRQAKRVASHYNSLRVDGYKYVVVLGDLNDTPDSTPLKPLLTKTDLQDVFAHPKFDDGGRPGTYGNCAASNKIDYILLSPALFKAIKNAGVFRKGVWGGKNGDFWDIYPEMTKPQHAGSDHAAVWVDIDL
ncbi:MAG: endonuclease/exonuclease/phosphatase family protein [Beijerinckiaceae bacterium]